MLFQYTKRPSLPSLRKQPVVFLTKFFCDYHLAICRINNNLLLQSNHQVVLFKTQIQSRSPWSSVVEGDEQLDWPNSQTTVELGYASVA